MYPIALALVPSFDTFCNVINVVRVPSVVGWVRDEVLKALVAFEVINADLEAILTVPPEIERTPFQRTMFVGCNVGLPWTTHGLLFSREGTDQCALGILDLRNYFGNPFLTAATDEAPGKWGFDEVNVTRPNSAGNPFATQYLEVHPLRSLVAKVLEVGGWCMVYVLSLIFSLGGQPSGDLL